MRHDPNDVCRQCGFVRKAHQWTDGQVGHIYECPGDHSFSMSENFDPPAPPTPRRRVYLAGPISKGDLAHNITQASQAFEALALAGLAPWCPHWSVFSGPVQVSGAGGSVYAVAGAQPSRLTHADWLAVDLAWVAVADAVLRLPGESVGADRECEEARRLGIPVFESVSEVIDWADARPAMVG